MFQKTGLGGRDKNEPLRWLQPLDGPLHAYSEPNIDDVADAIAAFFD